MMRLYGLALIIALSTTQAQAQPFIYGTTNQVPNLNYTNKDQMAEFCRRAPKRPICVFKETVIPGTPKMVAPEPSPTLNCTGQGKITQVNSASQFQAVIASAKPGETILLRPGSYGTLTVNRGGTPNKHIFIAAENPAVTTLAMPEAGERSGVAELSLEAPNVTVCGLFFESGVFNSIRARHTRLDNVHILRNYFNTGIKAEGVENSIAIEEGGIGIIVQSNYFNATRSTSTALDYGMLLYKMQGIIVRGNVFDGVFNRPISTKEDVSDALITGNVFRGCGQACMHVGQQPDYDGKDVSGNSVAITKNTFIEAYTTHPDSRYRYGLVLRNQENITVTGNTFIGRWYNTILTDFINRGGLQRLENRLLGMWGKKPRYILIDGNRFTDGSFRFTGRGNGPWDKIVLRNNQGPITCVVGPWQSAAGKRYDMKTINQSPPTVTGCPTR